MKIKLAAALTAVLLFASGSASAEGEQKTPTQDEIIGGIQQKYESINNFSADFVQETYQRSFDRTRSLSGKVCLAKPGKMLWDYSGVSAQQIVSNGSTLWYYQPGDKTVMMGDLKGALANPVPFDFLTGMGNIEGEFSVSKPDKPEALQPGRAQFTLIPKTPMPNIASIGVTVDLKTYLLDRIVINDHFGNRTALSFSNRKTDQPLPDKLFEFEIPKGVEVITPESL